MPLPKVVMVSRGFPPDRIGGGELVAEKLAQGLRDRYDVRVLTSARSRRISFPSYVSAVEQKSDRRFMSYARLYMHVRRGLRSIRPDVFHSTTLEVPRSSAPSVATVHHVGHLGSEGTLTKNPMAMRWAQRKLAKWRLRAFDQIVTGSRATAVALTDQFGVKPDRIDVIPWGVELWRNSPGINPAQSEGPPFRALLPSRISREKGQATALQAFRLLSSRSGIDVRLVVTGFGGDKGYLKELRALATGLPVEFVIGPSLQEMANLYSRSNFVVFPTTISEGFGLVAAEALSFGKPLISSDMPAIREIAGDSAIYVTPGSKEALADGIEGLITDIGNRTANAIQLAEPIRKKYTWEATCTGYAGVYEKVRKSGVS